MTEKKEAAVETAEEPKKTTKAKAKKSEGSGSTVNDIIESVKKMTVLELSELVKALEEEFGVTAAAPVVAAAAPGAPAAEAAPAEEEKILVDDVLIARGAPHGVDDLKRLAEGKISELTGRSEKT